MNNRKNANHRKSAKATAEHRAVDARRLDLLADLHLQLGFVKSAEHLAQRAAAMREGCP